VLHNRKKQRYVGDSVQQRNFREQLRRNAVALISLFIALTGLLYNTWRNEHSELNRNQRWACFEILVMLGEMQELVYLSHYDPEQTDDSDSRRGWTKVLLIRDLSTVLDGPVPETATELHAVWGRHWEGLEDGEAASKEAIEGAINELRSFTLMTLKDLD
jgi:hypothetical protein